MTHVNISIIAILLISFSGCGYYGDVFRPGEIVECKQLIGAWRSLDPERDGSFIEYSIVEMTGGIGIFNRKSKRDKGIFGTTFIINGNIYVQLHFEKGENFCVLLKKSDENRYDLFGIDGKSGNQTNGITDISKGESVRQAIEKSGGTIFNDRVATIIRIQDAAQQVDSAEPSTNAVPPSIPRGSAR